MALLLRVSLLVSLVCTTASDWGVPVGGAIAISNLRWIYRMLRTTLAALPNNPNRQAMALHVIGLLVLFFIPSCWLCFSGRVYDFLSITVLNLASPCFHASLPTGG